MNHIRGVSGVRGIYGSSLNLNIIKKYLFSFYNTFQFQTVLLARDSRKHGKDILEFSKKFLNNKFALATGSGTDALHLSYILSKIKKDDEVIVPIFTCTATNIPLLYIGAKIVFADVDRNSMNICTKSVEKLITKKTKAIVCVHYGGLPCDMSELMRISKKHNIILIEDVAQAIGAKYKNKNVRIIKK